MARKRKARYTPRRKASPDPGPPLPVAGPEPVYAPPGGRWYLHVLVFALLVAATCLLYSPDLGLGFFHVDDVGYVAGNEHIRAMSAENLRFVFTQPYFANYSPLHIFSYMVDYAIGGLDPSVYHWSNNIWAGVVAGFLYLLALLLLRSPAAAFVAALLFVVHPVHVEAVAWISSRKDIVAAAFALPCMYTYFMYRRGGRRARAWYGASLVLFLMAVAGKLSVVVIPGILFVFDLAIEKRRDKGLVLDKLPHALIILFFGLRVVSSQPTTRHDHDLFTIGHTILHNLVLMTGFGEYVMNRPRPDQDVGFIIKTFYSLAPLAVFAFPLALARWLPGKVVSFLYWVLLAMIPPLVLSFVHPVTDRYLFFPSVGVVLLIGWVLARWQEVYRAKGTVAALTVALVLTVGWTRGTLAYLGEWADPRSVWYAATGKSNDIRVYQYLGTHYQDAADLFLGKTLPDGRELDEARALARLMWEDHPGLDDLMAEWDAGGAPGPRTREYATYLRKRAAAEYQRALDTRSTRIVPNLYYRLAKLAMDQGDLARALELFELSYREAQRHSSVDVKDELTVRCRHAIGLVHWRAGRYEEALENVKEAEAEQLRIGRTWIPEIAEHRRRLEQLAGSR